MKRLAAMILAAAALAGCAAHPFVPASAAAAYVKSKPKPVQPSLLGVDVYSEQDYSLAQTQEYGEAVMGYLHNGLDAQVAAIMWDLCSPGKKSEVVHACAENAATSTGSMTAADISELAHIAKADGLKVAMRPIVRVGPPQDWDYAKISWEGHISPPNEQKWFESLLRAEMPYLRVARQVHAAQFVVTTEMASLQYSLSWPWFLGQAQKACGCQVSYATQMTEFQHDASRLPRVSELGADFYAAFRLSSGASQAAVTRAWEKAIAPVGASRLARTSLDEISIRATVGAYAHPADWNAGGKSDPTVQARYFTAACATAAHYHMHALFFYFVPLNDNIAHPVSYPAFFVRTASSKAISGCRKILG